MDRPYCAHCGNSYPVEKHEAICVRFGLNVRTKLGAVKPPTAGVKKKKRRRSASSWDVTSPAAGIPRGPQ